MKSTNLTPKDLIAGLDRAKIRARLNIEDNAISMALSRNRFPAAWFVAFSEECESAGLPCPPEFFGMRGVS